MAGAPELCLPVLKLAQVSLPARPRRRSMLLCVPAPCLSSTAQPDHRLHSVGGRRLSDAALEPTFDGCPAAASGSSMAARRSSRRRPRCHRGVHQWPERAAFDVRTAVGRRVCRPPPAGRSARTHCRAVWLLESLDVFRSVCPVKCDKLVHPGLDPLPEQTNIESMRLRARRESRDPRETHTLIDVKEYTHLYGWGS